MTVKTLPGIVVLKTDKPEIAEAYALASKAMLDMLLASGYPVQMRQPIETHIDRKFETDSLGIRVSYRIHPFMKGNP